MSDKIPQYSDFQLNFNNLSYNLSPTEVDLDSADDIICSISKGSDFSTPIFTVSYLTSPSDFDVDNTEKSVSVNILSSDIGTDPGKYWVNLWIVAGGEYVTHLKRSFDIEYSVSPS